MTCLAFAASAQGPQPQPNTAVVGFHNQTEINVIIKGYTIVNGMQRSGPLIQVRKGAKAFETNVPVGVRYYTVHDANNPQARVLLLDHAVPVRTPAVPLNIVPVPNNPNRVMIVPAP